MIEAFESMTWQIPTMLGILGLLIGSFLNVVIYRLPREGESVSKGRSMCPGCSKQIAWYDNIPVLSYILLRGKCRNCSIHISARYPLVELLTGVLFATVGFRLLATQPDLFSLGGVCLTLVHLIFVAALIAGTFIDFEFRILPDRITKPGMILAPILSALIPSLHGTKVPREALVGSLLGIAAGAGIIYGLGFVGKLLFKKDAMGLGDVKFLGMIGGILGVKAVLLTLVASSIFGSIFGVLWLMIKKDHYIPFGPFLAMGALTMLLFGGEVQYFLSVTYPTWVSQVLS